MRFISIALLTSVSAITGCASIVNGSNQSVSVETRADGQAVTGAACTLTNNKGTWYLTSPGSAVVNRSFEDLSVKCVKDAGEPGLATVKSSTKAMAFGNILFGGPIGAGVDVATGAAYDYPSMISVDMGKSKQVAPPAAAGASAAVAQK
jgi:hypothetical protein